MKTKMNRRTFLKVSTVAGSGLLVGCSFSSPKIMSSQEPSETELGLWIRIGQDDSITLVLPSAEMGQHAHTGQAMIIAEELEANWESINVINAPINSEYVNPELFNKQRTDGSTSISAFWDKHVMLEREQEWFSSKQQQINGMYLRMSAKPQMAILFIKRLQRSLVMENLPYQHLKLRHRKNQF